MCIRDRLTDALPKVRKLNRNVLVGFAGDAVAAAQIINKLDEYDVQYMTCLLYTSRCV